MPALDRSISNVGRARPGAISRALDESLWTGEWSEGTEYSSGDYAETEIDGDTEYIRALQSHTSSSTNGPSSNSGTDFWVLVTGEERLAVIRLRSIAGVIESVAAEGQVRLVKVWRGTFDQYTAITNKQDDTAYVTVG